MTPNCGVPNTLPGTPNRGVFEMLKNSARNCSENFSFRRVFLEAEKSKLEMPGSRTSGNVRPVVPKVNGAGWLKTDVLNHRSMERSDEDSFALWPLLLGREPPPNEFVLLVAVLSVSG